MPELADCPFCTTNCVELRRDHIWEIYIYCICCGARGSKSKSDAEAIRAWNDAPRPKKEEKHEATNDPQ